MQPYAIHLFVCTSGGTCPHQGAAEVHAFLREAVLGAKLKAKVRVNHAGCLDQCGHGPILVVYPEGIWYSHVTVEDAKAIFYRAHPRRPARGAPPVRAAGAGCAQAGAGSGREAESSAAPSVVAARR